MASTALPLRFQDPWEVGIPATGSFWQDGAKVTEGSPAEVLKTMERPQLQIRVRASTSGVLINNRVYPGSRMANSVGHFLQNFGKPYLSRHPKDHTDEPAVQGRITTATYTQLWTDKAWELDWRNPRSNGSQGSGFSSLGITVSDRDTIERVLDHRSLTLSVGFRPTAFFCSVCGHDWIAERSPCGHELGRLYTPEGNKKDARPVRAYGITGDLLYDHIADTAFPADPTAQILSSKFHDAAHSYFDTPADCTAGVLESFALADRAGNFWELDLDTSASMPIMSAPNENPSVAVVDLTDALRGSSKENPMANTAETPVSTPATPTTAVADAAAPAPIPAPAEGTSDTSTGDSLLDVNGNWTMPDPVDGHVHELQTLDKEGKGATTSAKGGKLGAHTHEIENGRLLPTNVGEGNDTVVSRHPGTWYYDTQGHLWMFKDGTKHRAKVVSESDSDSDVSIDYSDSTLNPEGVEKMDEAELMDHQEMVELHEQGILKDAVLTTAARKKLPNSAFCGPDRSFPAHDKSHVRNALARLSQGFPKDASATTKARILACVKRKAKALGVNTDAEMAEPWADSTSTTILKTLGQELEAKNTRVLQLEGAVREKQEELDALQEENQTLTQQHLANLIDRVLDLQIALRKPGVQAIKTSEDLAQARTDLAKRSLDSLADSTRDLQLELAQRPGGAVRLDPSQTPPHIDAGRLGGAPTSQEAATDPSTDNVAQQTLKSLRS